MNKLKVKGKQKFMGIEIPIIEGGFDENCRVMTAKTIAEIHGVRMNDIQELIKKNIDEFEIGVDLLDVKGTEYFKNIVKQLDIIISNRIKNFYVLSNTGYLKLYSLFRNKNEFIFQTINSYFGNNASQYVFTYNKEIRFRDRLSVILEQFKIDIKYQYHILKYFIDIYIPELNIAIEYDEGDHRYYTYEQQELRQKEIEEELDCKFIRVSDKYSIDVAIGKVLKELMILRKE